jgi:hypothetical protein
MELQSCVAVPLFNTDKSLSNGIEFTAILDYSVAIKAFESAIINTRVLLKNVNNLVNLDFIAVYDLDCFYVTYDNDCRTVRVATEEECRIENGDGDMDTVSSAKCTLICYSTVSKNFFMRFYLDDEASEYVKDFDLENILLEISSEPFKLKLNAQG